VLERFWFEIDLSQISCFTGVYDPPRASKNIVICFVQKIYMRWEAIMNQNILRHCTNEELNLTLRELRSREREIVSDVVLYLHEIDTRGFYRDLGYSSLFAYCVSGLGYSESGAQRRIQAARALDGHPEIYAMLRV
jgi:hypothetical protein